MPDFNLETAFQLTTTTIDRRAAHYRNLVIGVVTLIFVPGGWALIRWSWMPLTAVLGIVPLCAVFLGLDIKKIGRWQAEILAAWRTGQLDLDLFSQTMASFRILPTGTLTTMLATLPTRAISESGQTPSDDVKSMISRILKTNNQCQFYRILAIGMAAGFGVAALVAALIVRSWFPFVVFIGSLICIPLCRWLQWFRVNSLGTKMSDLENEPDREVLSVIISKMNLGAICEKHKSRWLAVFTSPGGQGSSS